MRRRFQRLASLLTVVILLLAPAASGALASTPASSGEPDHDIVLIPKDTNPDKEELQKVARRLLEDPLGGALYAAWVTLKGHPYKPANISVGIFHFDWMKQDYKLPAWVRGHTRDFLDRLQDEIDEPSSEPHKDYPLRAQLTIADPALYEWLGVPFPEYEPDAAEPLLQLATGSAYSGHSEVNMIEWLQRTVPVVLGKMARTEAEKSQIDRAVKRIIGKSGAGFAGQRSICGDCNSEVKDAGLRFDRKLAIAFFDDPKSPNGRRAARIINGGELYGMLLDEMVRLSNEAAEEANQNMGLAKHPCSPVNGSQMLVAGPPMAHPCGEGEGGVARALASSTYGGVDFSSLQLGYMSDQPGNGVQYAFSAQPASRGIIQDADAGRAAVTDSTADLRTWLVLSPDKFWVNLNPSEPDRIVDAALGQTNAGRALLEADWRMKRTGGRLLNPKTPFGAEYWNKLRGPSGKTCYSSRMWIVPGDVEVRQDGNELYILKATLDVKAKAEKINGFGGTECNADPEETARNERLEQEMVVPKIVKAVNKAPEYASLRRAFLARVVAQWIRDRHGNGQTTSFDGLIDSGDLGPAKLRGGWHPRQVYDRYVHSIQQGEFTYEQTNRVGRSIITYKMQTGGVDFSKLNPKKLSAAQMNQRNPGLQQTVKASISHSTSASDGSLWLGETAQSHPVSTWSKLTKYAGGRTGVLVILLVALAVVTFLIRDGSALRRRT